MTHDESTILIEMEARRQGERRRATDEADGFYQGEGDEMTESDFPPKLNGPRVEPDKPRVRLEVNCVCGATMETALYTDGALIKLVVVPCQRCAGRAK